MKRYATMALAGLFPVVTQPVLRAQDSRAEKERAIAAIGKLGGKVEGDTNSPDRPVVAVGCRLSA
jgi:hypothetical protein